jgi:hypothetical protein
MSVAARTLEAERARIERAASLSDEERARQLVASERFYRATGVAAKIAGRIGKTAVAAVLGGGVPSLEDFGPGGN